MPATLARSDLAAAAINCAEYLEEIIRDDLGEGCDWPNADVCCSRFCDDHGCAKARAMRLRAALVKEG